MTSKERLEKAWSFLEPDRVPIELRITQVAREHPAAKRLVQLIDEYADNFYGCERKVYDWGLLGRSSTYTERIIEYVPGEYTRKELMHTTTAGCFTAITRQPDDPEADADFHWEKRFITSSCDLERLLDVPLEVGPINVSAFMETVKQVGDRGLITFGLLHPLGQLVRNATMEEVYMWFIDCPDLIHRYLEKTTDYLVQVIDTMMNVGIGPYFGVAAHEMLIPPWAGPSLFEEFVVPYDKRICEVIHRHGGKLRAHCHGNAMMYLERFADIGIDAIEPLEGAPTGDCELAEAKRCVGGRMLLSGNIPSIYFNTWTAEQVREAVREAIRVCAPGGGFTLRTTGGMAGTSAVQNSEQLGRIIKNCEAYMLAGLEFGGYPITL